MRGWIMAEAVTLEGKGYLSFCGCVKDPEPRTVALTPGDRLCRLVFKTQVQKHSTDALVPDAVWLIERKNGSVFNG